MPFDLQPALTGTLLELRPLRPSDWTDLYAAAADPLIWEQHPVRNRYEEAVFKEFFHEALDSGGALVAIDRQDGRVVGSSRFHGYDAEKREIEIGWTFLARSHWGGRYGAEMKQLMLRHALPVRHACDFPGWAREPTIAEGVWKTGRDRRGFQERPGGSTVGRVPNHGRGDGEHDAVWLSLDTEPPSDARGTGW